MQNRLIKRNLRQCVCECYSSKRCYSSEEKGFYNESVMSLLWLEKISPKCYSSEEKGIRAVGSQGISVTVHNKPQKDLLGLRKDPGGSSPLLR